MKYSFVCASAIIIAICLGILYNIDNHTQLFSYPYVLNVKKSSNESVSVDATFDEDDGTTNLSYNNDSLKSKFISYNDQSNTSAEIDVFHGHSEDTFPSSFLNGSVNSTLLSYKDQSKPMKDDGRDDFQDVINDTIIINIHNSNPRTFHHLFTSGICSYYYNVTTNLSDASQLNQVMSKSMNLSFLPAELDQRSRQVYQHRFLFNISINCSELFRVSPGGTGNWIFFIYKMRLVMYSQRGSTLQFHCEELYDEKLESSQFIDFSIKLGKELILPWLTGVFPPISDDVWNEYVNPYLPLSTQKNVCDNAHDLSPIIPILRYELQRMSWMLVGLSIPHQENFMELDQPPTNEKNHRDDKIWRLKINNFKRMVESRNILNYDPFTRANYTLPISYNLLKIPNVTLDDAVIHFRCGDIAIRGHPQYGFFKYHALTKYLDDKSLRSVGILTQPFKNGIEYQTRFVDRTDLSGDRCELVVKGIISYIEDHLPHIKRVTIHNNPDETVALAIARMVFARRIIPSSSTFSILAGMATFGTMYLPRDAVEISLVHWFIKNEDSMLRTYARNNQTINDYSNMRIVFVPSEEMLPSEMFSNLWSNSEIGREDIMNWLRNDTFTINDFRLNQSSSK